MKSNKEINRIDSIVDDNGLSPSPNDPQDENGLIRMSLRSKGAVAGHFSEEAKFVCQVAGCNRPFASFAGLRIHQGKVHNTVGCVVDGTQKPLLEAERTLPKLRGVIPQGQFKRWSEEEMLILARVEFRFRNLPGSHAKDIYLEVARIGLDRNYNAVQRKLNDSAYKKVRDAMWNASDAQRIESENVTDERVDPESNSQKADREAVELEDILSTLVSALKSECEKECESVHESYLDHLVCLAKAGAPPQHMLLILDDYFKWIFEPLMRSSKAKEPARHQERSKAREKLWQFHRTQRLWEANRGKTARDVINGRTANSTPPLEIPGFFEHWAATFEPSKSLPPALEPMVEKDAKFNLWKPIGELEIGSHLGGMGYATSAGPDFLTVPTLKSLPRRVLVKWLNLFLYCGSVPQVLKRARTVFIPKSDQPSNASDFRPISMASVILRLFHKILAKRLINKVAFDPRQKAFLPVDGVAENIAKLDAMLDVSQRKKRELYLAMLDMKNAYGSVTHDAIFEAVKCAGADDQTVKYIRSLYTGFTTVLSSRGSERKVQVQRGVLQGDPLSPVLFNLVIDQVLRAIPAEVGFPVTDRAKVNGMAFADDLNVATQSPNGLQLAITHIEKVARPLGLEFNPRKCSILAKVVRKGNGEMKVHVDTGFDFRIDGQRVPMIGPGETFKYLGAFFDSYGLTYGGNDLDLYLERLRKAPLRVHQKLYCLRVHVIPKLIHRLTFAKISTKRLEQLDVRIRKFVYGLLHLPRGTPLDFLYCPVSAGGLGLLCLRRGIPYMIFNRFDRLKSNEDPTTVEVANTDTCLNRIRNAAGALVNCEELLAQCRSSAQAVNRQMFYKKIDGRGMRFAHEVPYVHQWVHGVSDTLSPRDFINALKLRVNALSCKSRYYRGTLHSRRCRAATCDSTETNEHIMQTCESTRDNRRVRHNDVVEVLSESLKDKHYDDVVISPIVRLQDGFCYPDLVAVKEGRVFVVDAQIIGDHIDPKTAYESKSAKYRDMSGFASVILSMFPGATSVKYGAVIINRRGCVALQTDKFCRKQLCLPQTAVSRMALRTVMGSLRIYKGFIIGNWKVQYKKHKRPNQPVASSLECGVRVN